MSSSYLSQHFLIAMPNLADSFFGDSLLYLFEHTSEGAMGMIVNQSTDLSLADVLTQLRPEGEIPAHAATIPVYRGGPVQTDHGFVLHSSTHSYKHTTQVGELSLTTSRDVLFAIADGTGPAEHLIALGYSGWGAGQLENEIKDNVWLSCPAEQSIIFKTPAQQRRAAAAGLLGIELSQLSHHAGNA